LQSLSSDLQADTCGELTAEMTAEIERWLPAKPEHARSSRAEHLSFLAEACEQQASQVTMAMQDRLRLKSANAMRAWQRLQEKAKKGETPRARPVPRRGSLSCISYGRSGGGTASRAAQRRPSSAPPVLRTQTAAGAKKPRALRNPWMTSPPIDAAGSHEKLGGSHEPQDNEATPPYETEPGRRPVAFAQKQRTLTKKLTSDEVRKNIAGLFGSAVADLQKVEAQAVETVSHFDLMQLGIELNLPNSEVVLAKEVFDQMDTDRSGALDLEEFLEAIRRLLKDKPVSEKSLQRRCKEHWARCDNSRTGAIDFVSFLKWFASNPFTEYDAETQCIINLAHRFSVSVQTVQEVKLEFDAADTNKDGSIDFEEFSVVLAKIMRIPLGAELPRCRARSLWMELHHGQIRSDAAFENFVPWWLNRKDALTPYQDLYHRVRQIGSRHLDPPAYPKTEEEDFDDAPRSPGRKFSRLESRTS